MRGVDDAAAFLRRKHFLAVFGPLFSQRLFRRPLKRQPVAHRLLDEQILDSEVEHHPATGDFIPDGDGAACPGDVPPQLREVIGVKTFEKGQVTPEGGHGNVEDRPEAGFNDVTATTEGKDIPY